VPLVCLQYVVSANLTADDVFSAEYIKNRKRCWQYQALQNKVGVTVLAHTIRIHNSLCLKTKHSYENYTNVT